MVPHEKISTSEKNDSNVQNIAKFDVNMDTSYIFIVLFLTFQKILATYNFSPFQGLDSRLQPLTREHPRYLVSEKSLPEGQDW